MPLTLGLFICRQEEKRAALQELEAARLKELARKHGFGATASAQQNSDQVCSYALIIYSSDTVLSRWYAAKNLLLHL